MLRVKESYPKVRGRVMKTMPENTSAVVLINAQWACIHYTQTARCNPGYVQVMK